ncbi:MAG: phosphate-starvation-inducible PsiE family protein [Syntrophobacteraceae bacterium]
MPLHDKRPDILKLFEKIVVLILLVLMMLTIAATVVEFASALFGQLAHPPLFSLGPPQVVEMFGLFLNVLIGLELLESTRIYLQENRMHADVVLLVAIIAVSRKVITLDYAKTRPATLFGISAVILALAIGYFVLSRARQEKKNGVSRQKILRWRKPPGKKR